MLRWIIRRKLDSEEKKLGGSMDYLRHIVDTSPTAFFRFASILPFANSRKTLPNEAWFAAQLISVQNEDCGPCLQITVNLAKQAGLDATFIGAVLERRNEDLPSNIVDVIEFTAVAASGSDDPSTRNRLRECYGERGLVELAYAIASSRIPPTVKRVLGYAESCSAIPVEL
ncbi:MAG: hypothetical protein R3E01_12880 [Pirellulaceae bacterium]